MNGVANVTAVGLDLSLTSTGFVVIAPDGPDSTAIVPPKKGPESRGVGRLLYIRGQLLSLIESFRPDIVILEGYAYGAVAKREAMGELGGVVKIMLHESGYQEGDLLRIVAPKMVKKFATGNGNADKSQMRLDVFKRWGFDSGTDDEADAFVMAKIGKILIDPGEKLTKFQEEIIRDLSREGKAKGEK